MVRLLYGRVCGEVTVWEGCGEVAVWEGVW